MKTIIALLTIAAVAVLLVAALPENDGLKQEIARLRYQNADLERRLLEASAPPIEIRYRKALTGDGYVFLIQNQTAKTLPVIAHLKSEAFGTEKNYEVILPPAKIVPGVKEIGYAEGWAAVPGDKIVVTSKNYNPAVGRIKD